MPVCVDVCSRLKRGMGRGQLLESLNTRAGVAMRGEGGGYVFVPPLSGLAIGSQWGGQKPASQPVAALLGISRQKEGHHGVVGVNTITKLLFKQGDQQTDSRALRLIPHTDTGV